MGSYSRIYIHLIFSVKGRASLIQPEWEESLFKYTTGVIKGLGHKLIAINGMPDHVHMVIGWRPALSISQTVREIKKSTNSFVKEKRFCRHGFGWQEGYAAISHSDSSLNTLINYVKNQKEHHRSISFQNEYKSILDEAEIEYEEKYLFDWVL